LKVKLESKKTLGVYDVIPLEGAMQGKSAATVEAIVLANVQSDDGCIRGDVVAVWGAVAAADIDDDTALGLVVGVPWPESGTAGLREFYAVDDDLQPEKGVAEVPG
jgi:hypothetical protein